MGNATGQFRAFAIILATVLVALLLALELALIYPTVRPIAEAFHTTQVGWIVTIGLVLQATTLPIVGKLGDLYGKKQVVLALGVLFLIGSVLSAMATGLPVLLVGRALQGAALPITALAFPVLYESLPERFIPIGIGGLGAMIGIALLAGPLISGILTVTFGFRAVFWFCTIYIVVAGAFFAVAVPDSGYRARRKLDLPGVVMLGGGIGLVFLAIENGGTWGWRSAPTLAVLVAGIVGLGLFVYHGLRVPEPVIDLRALASPALRVPIIVNALGSFGMGAFAVLLPLMVETPPSEGPGYGLGVSALGLFVFLVPCGLCGAIVGQVSGPLLGRGHVAFVLRSCMAAFTVGLAVIAFFHTAGWQLLVGAGITGLGFGLLSPSTGYLVVARAPGDQRAIASTVQGVAGAFGTGIATPVGTAVLVANLAYVNTSGVAVYTNSGFTLAFAVSAFVCLVGFGVTVVARLRPTLPAPSATEVPVASV
jgi:MFS family permease